MDKHRFEENCLDGKRKFPLFIKKIDFLIDGHRNLLVDVSGDPRVLECAFGIVSDRAGVRTEFLEEILS